MKYLISKYFTIAILLTLPALTYSANNCNNFKADSILVDSNGATLMLGAVSFSVSPMSGAGDPEPAGPKILYIFKKISTEYKKSLKSKGITAKEGDVLIWKKYPDISSLKYLCTINASISASKIKEKFLTK